MKSNLQEEAHQLSMLKTLTMKKILNSDYSNEFQKIIDNTNAQNARQVLYHCLIGNYDVPTCQCGVYLKWNPDKRCYRKFCSTSCTAKYTTEIKKQQNLKKFGKEWHTQTEEWREKVKSTSNTRYNADHYSQTQEFIERSKDSNLKRFGEEHPAKSTKIQEKTKKYFIETYGVENPMQSKSVLETLRHNNLEKYGVDNPMKLLETKRKVIVTNLEKYGVANPMQNPEIATKSGKLKKENYYNDEILAKLNSKSWLTQEHLSGKTIAEIADSLGVSFSNLGKYFARHNIEIQRLPGSYVERKLLDFFQQQQINVIHNDRTVIQPKELDFFLPDHNFAIEINGIYWHSEKFNKDKYYHQNKTKQCYDKGITLWQFWDSELDTNWQLITSKILTKLGHSKKVGARTLEVKKVHPRTKTAFFKENHLQGDCASKINLGLHNKNNELIACATFGKPRFSKKYHWELLRLATKKGITVQGGASKLLTHFTRNFMTSEQTLVSYCNRRFSDGNLYRTLGFERVKTDSPGFVYTYGSNIVGSRLQWQKHLLAKKLNNFDNLLTANENLTRNGYYRLWDCGQDTWVLSQKIL